MSGSRTGTIDWGRKTPGRSPYLFGWPTAVNSIKFSSDGWFSHIYAFPLHIILLNLILVLSNVSLVFFAAWNLGLLNAMFCELEYHLWINWRIIHHCAPAIYVWITWFLIALCVCVCVTSPISPKSHAESRFTWQSFILTLLSCNLYRVWLVGFWTSWCIRSSHFKHRNYSLSSWKMENSAADSSLKWPFICLWRWEGVWLTTLKTVTEVPSL